MRISDWSSDLCSSDLIAFVVATDSTEHSIGLARDSVVRHGALSLAAYTTDDGVAGQVPDAAEVSGVALLLKLTGPVFVNPTAAFSDIPGTGPNHTNGASAAEGKRRAAR